MDALCAAIPVARGLLKMADSAAPRVLCVAAGNRRAVLRTEGGAVVEVCGVDAESLGDTLLRQGALDAERHYAALEAAFPVERVGAWLISVGAASEPAVRAALELQLVARVSALLRWRGAELVPHATPESCAGATLRPASAARGERCAVATLRPASAACGERCAVATLRPACSARTERCAAPAAHGAVQARGPAREQGLNVPVAVALVPCLYAGLLSIARELPPDQLRVHAGRGALRTTRLGQSLERRLSASFVPLLVKDPARERLAERAALRAVGALVDAGAEVDGYSLLLRKRRELRMRATAHRLLDLPDGAPPAQARSAFRRLARKLHPDRFHAREPGLVALSNEVMRALTSAEAELSAAVR